MRVLSLPEFSAKVKQLPHSDLRVLSEVVNYLETENKASLFGHAIRYPIQSLGGQMFVLRATTWRLFLTFRSDQQGEYLLLLDFMQYGSHYPKITAYQRRDPQFDGSINPTINGNINPLINGSLNPLINGNLNPFINGSLNPYINGSLNPLINGDINPLINGSINPLINGNINPNINGSINPSINSSYEGPFIYDLGLMKQGYLVKANEVVYIAFLMNNEMDGICVRNSVQGLTRFDRNNGWVGHFIPDQQGGYLVYDKNNNWIGIAV